MNAEEASDQVHLHLPNVHFCILINVDVVLDEISYAYERESGTALPGPRGASAPLAEREFRACADCLLCALSCRLFGICLPGTIRPMPENAPGSSIGTCPKSGTMRRLKVEVGESFKSVFGMHICLGISGHKTSTWGPSK